MEQIDNIAVMPKDSTELLRDWMTVKQASIRMNNSETHVWRIIEKEGWGTIKRLHEGRKKSFVQIKNVEDYLKEPIIQENNTQAKKPEEQSTGGGSTSTPIDPTKLDFNEIIKNRETFIGFLEQHKSMLTELSKVKKENAVVKEEFKIVDKMALRWRLSTFFMLAIGLISAFILGLWLFDTKDALTAKTKVADTLSEDITILKIQLTQAITKANFSKSDDLNMAPIQASDFSLKGALR